MPPPPSKHPPANHGPGQPVRRGPAPAAARRRPRPEPVPIRRPCGPPRRERPLCRRLPGSPAPRRRCGRNTPGPTRHDTRRIPPQQTPQIPGSRHLSRQPRRRRSPRLRQARQQWRVPAGIHRGGTHTTNPHDTDTRPHLEHTPTPKPRRPAGPDIPHDDFFPATPPTRRPDDGPRPHRHTSPGLFQQHLPPRRGHRSGTAHQGTQHQPPDTGAKPTAPDGRPAPSPDPAPAPPGGRGRTPRRRQPAHPAGDNPPRGKSPHTPAGKGELPPGPLRLADGADGAEIGAAPYQAVLRGGRHRKARRWTLGALAAATIGPLRPAATPPARASCARPPPPHPPAAATPHRSPPANAPHAAPPPAPSTAAGTRPPSHWDAR